MKKMNNRGFMLTETLIVATFLVTTLLFLYIQFNKVTKTYEDSFKYNTVNGLYATNNILDYLQKEGMGKLAEKLNGQTYVDFTSCSKDFFFEQSYCQVLLESLKVEKALFTKADLTNIKASHKGLDQDMVSFIDYLKDTSSLKYRLLVKFKDGTFASINVDFCSVTANSVFVISDTNKTIPDCITNDTKCDPGTPVAVKVNDEEIYDFYVMSDNNSELTLIMDRNLGETVAWISKADYLEAGGTDDEWLAGDTAVGNNNKGPLTALNTLEDRTSSWTNIPSSTYILTDENGAYSSMTRTARARLITDSEAQTLLSLSNNSWVYGNLYRPPYGYWTSSASTSAYSFQAWNMFYSGGLSRKSVDNASGYGIRPVITIPKTINTCN